MEHLKDLKTHKLGIYSLEVEDKQYNIIKNKIEEMKNCKEPYKFNIVGLFAVSINKEIHTKHSFYCAEFVKYLFDKAKIKTNLPFIAKPEDFKTIEKLKLEYKGKLRDYPKTLNK